MAPRSVPVLERILDRIIVSPKGCWLWPKNRTRDGYGLSSIARRNVLVHRVVYEALVGPVPSGLQLDHLCRVRLCCNPDHLEVVTLQENLRRGERATKTHCIRGHEFTPENTRVDRRGHRNCRACARWRRHA